MKLSLPDSTWQFAIECCVTLDERARESGENERRPFPQYDYLRDIIETVDQYPFSWIVKSGQLTVSWCLQAYYLHQVLFHRGYRLAYYCLTQSKAEGHIESRFWRLYQSIPSTFNKPHAEYKGGRLLVYHDGPGTLPTSYIVPMAAEQGAQEDAAAKMRSETWTRALLDESAFYPNLEELHNSLIPRAGGITHVSTPNGHNFFERIGLGSVHSYKERPVSPQSAGAVQVRKGVLQWERNGFACLSVLYPAHPDRDPDTEKGAEWKRLGKLRSTARLWEREQEGSFDVAAGQPVYETEKMIVRPQEYIRGNFLFRGWDFGHRYPFVVWAQFREIRNDKGELLKTVLCFLREFTKMDSSTEDMARMVKAETERVFPNAVCRDFCDFYGGNQVRSSSPKSDVEILKANGIFPLSTPEQVKLGVELIQKLIMDESLEIDGDNCPTLVTAFRSGYVRGENGELPTEREKEEQHPFCDVSDAARYLARHAFRFVPHSTGPSSHRPEPMQGGQQRAVGMIHARQRGSDNPNPRPAPAKLTATCYRPGRPSNSVAHKARVL